MAAVQVSSVLSVSSRCLRVARVEAPGTIASSAVPCSDLTG